ncbi:MAG: hypothetical protein ABI794_08860 [Betaproteobacteria bacterium]
MRRYLFIVAALLVWPVAAAADRISGMTPAERCAYDTKLQLLAVHFHGKGTPRAEVKIHWHGDETLAEIDFINRALDAGYAMIEREIEAGRKDTPLQILGDRLFEACMSGADT